LRYGLSCREVEELLGEREVEVDNVTIYRWVQRFTPLLADAAGRAGTRSVTGGSSTRPTSKPRSTDGLRLIGSRIHGRCLLSWDDDGVEVVTSHSSRRHFL